MAFRVVHACNYAFKACFHRWNWGGECRKSLKVANAAPKGLEITVCQGHRLDGTTILGNMQGFSKPIEGFVQPAKLGGVAGEIKWDDWFAWKEFCSGKQRFPGQLQAGLASAAERVGTLNPALGIFRRGFDHALCDGQCGIPALPGSADLPADFEHFRVVQMIRGDSGDFLAGFAGIPQFEPTDRCTQVMQIGM